MNRWLLAFALAAGALLNGRAQNSDALDLAKAYVQKQIATWQLLPEDVRDMALTDRYQSAHNGVTHLYFAQQHAGIPVFTGIMGVHVRPDGRIAYANHRFVSSLASKVNATQPALTPLQAIERIAEDTQTPQPWNWKLTARPSAHRYVYDGGAAVQADVTVQLVWQPLRTRDEARLAWHVTLAPAHSSDWWSARVDALTGEILEKNNWTLYCSFHQEDDTAADAAPHVHSQACLQTSAAALPLADGAQYRVFPFPAESPIHGARQLVVNPADPLASPFGWHDTTGVAGADFTITKGNNAHAYPDPSNANASTGGEPDGGSSLVFDFPFVQDGSLDEGRHAAVVNLFYANNMMHDIFYHYGFDEESGNFQQNNYGRGGTDRDGVRAEARDGGGINNANFATPPDGQAPRMQMYLWRRVTGDIFEALAPEAVVGVYSASVAGFGPRLSQTPLVGQLAIAEDNSSQPLLVCNAVANASEVAGKIVLINRGECTFKAKALNAQQAGAIAVIICNQGETTQFMGNAPQVTDSITIPVIMLRNSDCQRLRVQIQAGQTVIGSLRFPPNFDDSVVDSSFDNGIIAHEYGHGISNRLTGGPSQADCLFNDEQMGEGWSDFFTLITTARPGDNGAMARGIGNYAIRNAPNGPGIRRRPYSTNPAVNAQVYDDVIGTTAPHPLGEVWASVLWDLYWRLVEVYGWDEDITYGNGGNNIAIRLVMDGMKFQECLPGFIDGRNGILIADEINYNGAHQCLIWEVFARRGLGWEADQGDYFNRNDGRQSFLAKPECIAELKIEKALTPLIEAGEEIQASIRVINHKPEHVTSVAVNDFLPAGAGLVPGSVTGAASFALNGDQLVFQLGEIPAGQERIIRYRMTTSPNVRSIRRIFDDMETPNNDWAVQSLTGNAAWTRISGQAASGLFAWAAPATNARNDQVLTRTQPIDVTSPNMALRFTHSYDTEPGIDGGIVQFSQDGGATWEQPEAAVFRNGYRGRIASATFGLSNTQAFWGNSGGFVQTWYDLSSYLGQQILVRFRYGTDVEPPNTPAPQGQAWIIDNFEVMDLVSYNAEACVTSAQGDLACAQAPARGAIVQPGLPTALAETLAKPLSVQVFPNPARQQAQVALHLTESSPVSLQLWSANGRLLRQQTADLSAGKHLLPLQVQDLGAGVYYLRVHTAQGSAVEKVAISPGL